MLQLMSALAVEAARERERCEGRRRRGGVDVYIRRKKIEYIGWHWWLKTTAHLPFCLACPVLKAALILLVSLDVSATLREDQGMNP